jgi:WD40 repeat protein
VDPLDRDDPQQVGSYRLLGRLGAGGMGQVFLGISPGGRKVAVKLLHEGIARDPEFRKRFAREVTAARRVGGFHTAQVVNADADAMPPWMATAYIPGPSLEEAVREHGPMGAEAVRALGAALAEGLAAIHDCGLIHRDLKPANIIVTDDGPRIMDFGIAHLLDATSTLTATGKIIGTYGYMSPEQIKGDPVGPQSDIFSLGSVLTYAATGHGPFNARWPAAVYSITLEEPDLRGVPASLRDVIVSCLAKRPAGRPALSDLLRRLGEAGATGPAQGAGYPWAGEPTRPKAATPRGAAAAARAQPTAPTRPKTTSPMPGAAAPARAQPTAPTRPRAAAPAQAPEAPARPKKAAGGADRPDRPAAQAQEQPGAAKPPNGGQPASREVSIDAVTLDGQASVVMPAAIAFSPDGRLLAVAGSFGAGRPAEVRFWDVSAGRLDSPPASGGKTKALTNPSAALFFSPNGRFLACQAGSSAPQLWDMPARQPARLAAAGEPGAPARLTFSPDGRLMAAIHDNQQLRLWDAATGRPLGGPLLTSARVCGPVFSPDGHVLAFPDSAGTMRFWRVTSAGSPQRLPIDSPADSTRIAFSRDGSLVAIARKGPGSSARPLIYSLATFRQQGGQPGGAEFPVNLLRFSPSGVFLAAADAGYQPSRAKVTFAFWDVTEAQPRARTVNGLAGVARKIAFSPDSRLLSVLTRSRGGKPDTSGERQAIHLWDTARDRPAGASPVDCVTRRPAAAMEFSRDGRLLATGSSDQSVTLWYTATMDSVALPRKMTGSDPVLAFSPDGTRLATAAPGVLRVWDLRSL